MWNLSDIHSLIFYLLSLIIGERGPKGERGPRGDPVSYVLNKYEFDYIAIQ
jgi:hypothetical protein